MRRVLLNTGSLAVAASALVAAAHGVGAAAQEDLMVEGNVALVSDYRFRGITQSGEEAAIQGGFDLALDSGFYVGTWGSAINFANGTEVDVYGGYGFEAAGLSFDVGGLLYTYPGADDTMIGEIYGSVGTTLGPVDASAGVAYIPEQENTLFLGEELDNLYLHASDSMPLGESLTLSGSVGYTDSGGYWDFSQDQDGLLDWSVGVSTSILGVDVGLSYVDTSEDFEGMDETVVLSFSKAL
jgi:uncharacterized protein (TIGR02001 family)